MLFPESNHSASSRTRSTTSYQVGHLSRATFPRAHQMYGPAAIGRAGSSHDYGLSTAITSIVRPTYPRTRNRNKQHEIHRLGERSASRNTCPHALHLTQILRPTSTTNPLHSGN